MAIASSSSVTSICVRPPTATCWGVMPMNENLSVASAGTLSVNVPEVLVVVPMVVPSTMTDTPAMGWPALSFTVPLTGCCA